VIAAPKKPNPACMIMNPICPTVEQASLPLISVCTDFSSFPPLALAKSHLPDRRTGEFPLDICLHRLQQLPAARAGPADGDHREHERGVDGENRSEADQQDAAGVDEAGVHQRRGGRRGGHRGEQPAVKRDQGGLYHRREHERAAGDQPGRPTERVGGRVDPRDRRRPGRPPQRRQRDSEDRATREEVPPGDRRGRTGLVPAAHGPDEFRHQQPHRHPEEPEQRDVVGRDERHHDSREPEHGEEELRFVGAPGHVPAGVAVNDTAEERYHHPHQNGQPVDGDDAGDLQGPGESAPRGQHGEARGEQSPREPRRCNGHERRVNRRLRERSDRRVRAVA